LHQPQAFATASQKTNPYQKAKRTYLLQTTGHGAGFPIRGQFILKVSTEERMPAG